MKKGILVFLLAAGIFVWGCASENVPEPAMHEWTFQAVYTKAAVNSLGEFSWQKADRIAVWNAQSGAFVPFNSVTGSGMFRAVAPADAHFTTAAIYPAGVATTTASVNLPASYGSPEASAAGFPMYAAVAEDTELLEFKHLGALLELRLRNTPAGAVAVVLSSTGKSLSGSFGIGGTPARIEAPSGSGAVRVTIPATEKGDDITVIIPLPVGSYPLSISLEDGEGSLFTLTGTQSIGFERAHLYRPAPIVTSAIEALPISADIESYNLEEDDDNWY